MTRLIVLLTLTALCGAHLSASPRNKPLAPHIEKLERSPRQDGVWQRVKIGFLGRKSTPYRLELKWDAHTLKETGQGTTNSKRQWVKTDARGRGLWTVEVKGYPAGKLRARVTDQKGIASEWSPNFDVPWLY